MTRKDAQVHAAKIDAELAALAKKRRGVLNPHAVVEFARNPRTALHREFDWQDTVAAQKWRVHQARMLIRVRVIEHPGKHDEFVRSWVSLVSDRTRVSEKSTGGGYRPLQQVMGREALRAMWLADALAELNRVRAKYEQIKDLLTPVWAAVDAAAKKKASRKAA